MVPVHAHDANIVESGATPNAMCVIPSTDYAIWLTQRNSESPQSDMQLSSAYLTGQHGPREEHLVCVCVCGQDTDQID